MGRLSGDFLQSFCFNTFDARCSRRSLCRAPALSRCLCRASELYRLCRSPALSVSGAQRVRAPTHRAPGPDTENAPTQRAPGTESAGRAPKPDTQSGAGRHRERRGSAQRERRESAGARHRLLGPDAASAESAQRAWALTHRAPGPDTESAPTQRAPGPTQRAPAERRSPTHRHCVSGPGVGARSLALCVHVCVGLRRSPAALCVGPRHFLCSASAVCRSARRSRRSGALCVRTQHPLRGAPCLCVGAGRCLCRPQRSLCRGRRSLCRPVWAAALSSIVVCVGSRHSLSGLGPLPRVRSTMVT